MAQTYLSSGDREKIRERRIAAEKELLATFGIDALPQGCDWVYQKQTDGSLKLEGLGRVEKDDEPPYSRSLIVMDSNLDDAYRVAVSQVRYYHDGINPDKPGTYYLIL